MKQNKTTYRIVIIATFIGINALILFGIGQVLAYLNTGADSSLMFHSDPSRKTYYTPEVVWKEIENPGRPMDKALLKDIENDYLDAWFVRNTALGNSSTKGIEDLYTEHARENLEAVIRQNALEGIVLETTTLSHYISLDFFSADGQLVVLSDENVHSYSRIIKNEELILETDELANYKVVLLLEDGYWRIRHMEKMEAVSEPSTSRIDFTPDVAIKGVNYYPQFNPWDTFGPDFSSEVLETDFKIIKGLDLNTVRIFVGYEDFGKAEVNEEKLARLMKLMDLAEKHQLKVLVTLFDFYGDYSVADWTATYAHAQSIVGRLKDHSALFAWDVKNEPDLDFENRGAPLVKAWLRQIIQTIRAKDPAHPITIGWSSAEAAKNLTEAVDFIAFHYYDAIEDFPGAISELQAITQKPIVVEEFGLSTYDGFWNPFGPDEEGQKSYYQAFLNHQKRDSIHYLFWTLYDFPDVPDKVAGRIPWRKSKQREFGIIKGDGAKKEAFHVLKSK